MYKVLEVTLTAKCLLGMSTEPGINSHRRVHYRLQVRYHNTIANQKFCNILVT